jgi:hypothetical protein
VSVHAVLWLTISDWLSLASAGFGMIGTLILFAYSYALPPAGFGAPRLPGDPVEQKKVLDAWEKRANRAQSRQRLGLAFLCVGFFLQAVAILWPVLGRLR